MKEAKAGAAKSLLKGDIMTSKRDKRDGGWQRRIEKPGIGAGGMTRKDWGYALAVEDGKLESCCMGARGARFDLSLF